MRLIYINTGLSSVFESQVLDLLKALRKLPDIEKIWLCCGYVNFKEKNRISQLAKEASIDTLFYRSFPNYPFFNFFNRITLRKSLKSLLSDRENLILHVRGEIVALHLYKTLKQIGIPAGRVLIDIRGASIEEIDEYTDFHPIIKKLKIQNFKNALKALVFYPYINAVSLALKEYILEKSHCIPESISVISNLAGDQFKFSIEKRISIRQELGISNDEILLVFSSGGTGLWQNNEIIIELAQKGYKVLNLSKTSIPHTNIITRHIPYSDVPGYLSAADIALILRENSIVNYVASPVKFSEFMCSGLPVIANRNVNLIDEYLRETGNGVIIKNIHETDHNVILKLGNIPREKISRNGKEKFSLDTVSSGYLKLYNKMLVK